MSDTIRKGTITELRIQLAFIKAEYDIFVPVNRGKIDLIFVDKNSVPKKVQVKTSRKTATGFEFNGYSQIGTRGGTQGKIKYNSSEIDFFATIFNDVTYLIPIADVKNRTVILLRINEKYKNQHKPLFAKNYVLKEYIAG